ncbi:ribbon-helix-helix protein, CopG family [bacterium D16-76]|nr:ribbon-helix-helix protein, CopG family [bacterium D16-76]
MSVPKDKYKFALWLHPDTLAKVKELYRQDDCRSKSEFIEKAIRFYIGCLTAEDGTSYLPNAFLSNMKSIVAESDNRQSKMIFKLAVELAMLMNVVAASSEIDEISLARLRGECVQEVKRLNGNFRFEDAVEWQS